MGGKQTIGDTGNSGGSELFHIWTVVVVMVSKELYTGE